MKAYEESYLHPRPRQKRTFGALRSFLRSPAQLVDQISELRNVTIVRPANVKLLLVSAS